MDKYFGQRNSSDGSFRQVNFQDISKFEVSQQSGCDVFFKRYIKSILENGALSAQQMQRKSIRPDLVIREIISENPNFKNSGVRVANFCEEELLIDAHQMKFAFSKIIENAIQYSAGTMETYVQIQKVNHEIVVCIKDEGVGIDPYEKEKIFNPFFRGLDSAKFSKGIGLGLTLSREIVRQHDAEMRVESAGRGFGTSVYISFPFEDKPVVYAMEAGRPDEAFRTLAY